MIELRVLSVWVKRPYQSLFEFPCCTLQIRGYSRRDHSSRCAFRGAGFSRLATTVWFREISADGPGSVC